MSGIAAVFQRDGAPVPPPQIQAMTQCIAHRGPDGIHHWSDSQIALGHCELRTLPEDDAEELPLASADGMLHITFDGRIDNRDELLPLLGLPKATRDARVVLAAYEKWGDNCPELLLGDFAFAIWDSRNRSLFCARDILGVCPLYYFNSPGVFLAASERSALFTHPSVTYAPNEPVIAGLLYVTNISQSETIHRDVLRLPPASCLTITATDLRIRRYWRIQDFAPVRCNSSSDYAEQLWTILTEAVRCRSRSRGGIGILLSGGLDSTAVAAAACDLRKRGQIEAKGVSGYSLVFPGWEEADESGYIDQTSAMLELATARFPPSHREPGGYEATIAASADLPDYPNDAFLDGLRRSAVCSGNRVLLTGIGGDEWMTGSDFQYSALIRKGQFIQALRLAQARSDSRRMSVSKLLWHYGLRPLLPSQVVTAVRLVRKPRLADLSWIPSSFGQRTCLTTRIAESFTDVSRRASPSNHYFLAAYERGLLSHFLESHGRINARFGIECRHPFHDRRVIEFANGIPENEKLTAQFTKATLRNALEGRAPDIVRHRRDKAHFTRMVPIEMTTAVADDFWDQLGIADRGWVDKQEIRVVWERFLASAQHGDYRQGRLPWSLWRAFGLEQLVRRGLL